MFNIKKLFLAPCDTYDDVYLRSYEMRVSGSNMNELAEVTEGGRTFAHTALAGVAGKMLRPTTSASSIAPIVNGWNERRYRFMMEVVREDPFMPGQESVDIFSGYTDYMGVNEATGTVDPNMRFFFTNITTLRRVRVSTPHGLQYQVQHTGTNQLLTGTQVPTFSTQGISVKGPAFTAQPQDVFSSLTRRSFSTDIDYDTNLGFNNGVKLNRRRNSIASRYVGDVLQAHVTTLADMDANGSHEDYNSVLDVAKGMVKEQSFSSTFYTADLLADESFVRHGYMTYGRLNHLCPHLDQVTYVASSRAEKIRYGMFGGRGSTDGWGGRNTETIMATILAQAIPSFMFDLGITIIGLTLTNRTLDGSFHVGVTEHPPVKTFTEGMDTRPLIGSLLQYLRTAVLPDLSVNRGQGIDITAIIDVMGDTAITISLDGAPAIPFTVPSFADSLFSTVLTDNMQGVDIMAGHFEELASSLAVNNTNRHSPLMMDYGSATPQYRPTHPPADIYIDPGFNHQHPSPQYSVSDSFTPTQNHTANIVIE